MQAAPYRITEYFNGEKQSVIPLFQRPYTWEHSHWETLWNDVLHVYEDATGKARHFMGAIVSLPATTIPVGVTKHLIIDGQQRLTTLAVLLRALKDVVSQQEAGRIDDLLINRHREGAERLKLLPTQTDRDVFKRLMCDQTAPNDQHRLARCYHYFRQQLDANDDNDNPVDPSRVLEALRIRLQVVSIGLDVDDDPYEIFESLNYKGEPLIPADLVRNHILMRFKHSIEQGDPGRS